MKATTAFGGSAAGLVAASVIAAAGGTNSVQVGNLAITWWVLVIAFAINWAGCVYSWFAKTERFYDITGTVTYLSITWFSLIAVGRYDTRGVILAAIITIWTCRLGWFLFKRILSTGKDRRFDRIKTNFAQLFLTWTLQAVWAIVAAGAAITAISTRTPAKAGLLVVVGLVIWLGGITMEATADAQKRAFKADTANDGRFIHTGLWARSRHPNYAGEIILWVGVAIIAAPALSGWQYLTLVSPAFVYFLLTRVSGVPLLERYADKKWGDEAAYQTYKANTPVLWPKLSRPRSEARPEHADAH